MIQISSLSKIFYMNFPISRPLSDTPPYPFAEVDKLVANLKAQNITPIDFGVGDPTSPTPDFIVQAAQKSLAENTQFGYPSNFGNPNFREAASAYMKRSFGVALDMDREIAVTNGSKEAVFHYGFCHVNPGDTVIVPTPGYPSMKNGVRFAGGTPFYVPLREENNFLIDFESIPDEVADKAVMIWTQYPNSPTGASPSLDWYRKFYAWARSHDLIIAADEGCYIDIYFGDKPHSILEVAKEGVITFYSLSKRNNMTNYRIGWVGGDADLVGIFKKMKLNVDSGVINASQDAAIVALEDEDHVASMREEYKTKQDILLSAFRDIGLPECLPDSTFYVWQKAPEGMTGVDFAKKLLSPEIAIVCTPGAWISELDFEGENPGENFVRFALMPTLEQVEQAAALLREHF